MPTTSYGHELAIGDHTERDDTPVCCDSDMTSQDHNAGHRDYTCGVCSAVVTIDPNGIVFDVAD
ncbi:hypothetical protein AB0E62_34170 [Streptomyces sp. NPDC038707]|uniref:hypothetical protein n=1 Tax=Streptomyces sp. NPDC038707 TaxID=3154329 RepID=UPI0033D7089A